LGVEKPPACPPEETGLRKGFDLRHDPGLQPGRRRRCGQLHPEGLQKPFPCLRFPANPFGELLRWEFTVQMSVDLHLGTALRTDVPF
jgi:hypothetical protein